MSKISIAQSDEEIKRLDLESVRENASNNIEKAALADTRRFNRGRANIKPFTKGDFVFLKTGE